MQTMIPFESGFVVGLADGAVKQWTGSGWRELHNSDWHSGGGRKVVSAVNTMVPYRSGFVIGLNNGAVQRWTGTLWIELLPANTPPWPDPTVVLHSTDAPYGVTAMLPFGSEFVMGRRGGAVLQWTGSDWRELQDDGWKSSVYTMLPYGSGFVVGLADGAVQQWTGSGWQELKGIGGYHGVRAMVPYLTGFVVGLEGGAVEQYRKPVV